MLTKQDFDTVCNAARDEATLFSKFVTSHEIFEQDSPTKIGYAYLIARLKHFMNRKHISVIDLDHHASGFGSWLMKTGDGEGGITIYRKQLAIWYTQTKLPLHVQQIRCIVHELGHIKLSPHLLKGTVRSQNAPHATPLEEEFAWLFTCVFLGAFLGDYSRQIRLGSLLDDAPRKYL
jgi:hypothetical protein